MHQLPGKRALALIFGLATAAAGSAYAQDTTDMGGASMDSSSAGAGALDTTAADSIGADSVGARDTTDTSGVQNPPGYRGMERDTTIFPDSGSAETRPMPMPVSMPDSPRWTATATVSSPMRSSARTPRRA